MLTNGVHRKFGVGPGFVYWCDGNMYATPKSYGLDIERGPCGDAAFFEGDAGGVFYCDGFEGKDGETITGVFRLSPGTGSSELVTATEDCHVSAIDADNVYYVIFAFEGVANPGLFRVARSGGTPTRLMSLRPRQDVVVAVDDDGLWVGSVWDGTIKRVAKADGKATTLITGQRKGITELVTDAEYIYWVVESQRELRRRKKLGGPIEVVARKVHQSLRLVRGNLYWVELVASDFDARLMRLSPGAREPQEVIAGLSVPVLAIDDDGIYFSEHDKQGLFMMPHPP